MQITVQQLRNIIKEEVKRNLGLKNERASLASLRKSYGHDPDKEIPPDLLGDVGIPADDKYDYHFVYSTVAKEIPTDTAEKDIEFWDPYSNEWEPITDDMRHHPTDIHNPQGKKSKKVVKKNRNKNRNFKDD